MVLTAIKLYDRDALLLTLSHDDWSVTRFVDRFQVGQLLIKPRSDAEAWFMGVGVHVLHWGSSAVWPSHELMRF